MDINDNQQLNTFESGMNTDTADYVLAKNQYREARNLRLTTDDSGNSAELHIIEGNVLVETLVVDYDQFISKYNPNDYKILAVNTVRNIGVIIVKNLRLKVWNIIKLVLNEDNTIDNTWVFGDTGITDMLEGDAVDTVLRWESSSRIKLYIADGKHYMLAINVAQDYTDPKIEQFLIYPSAKLKAPKFVDITSNGTLTSGLYQYAYQRYSVGGAISEMSRTTKMIPLVLPTGGGWYAGAEAGKTTSGAITILIPGDDGCVLPCLRVYRIHYYESGQTPTIELFTEIELSSAAEDVTVVDTGQTASATLTTEEFNSVSGVHIIPSCIESKHDYLFAAGISELSGDLAEIADFDTRTYSFKHDDDSKNECVVDGESVKAATYEDGDGVDTIAEHISSLKDVSNLADCIQTEDCKYAPWINSEEQTWTPVYGGVGPNVRWRFIRTKLDADYTPAITSTLKKKQTRVADIATFLDKTWDDDANKNASELTKIRIKNLFYLAGVNLDHAAVTANFTNDIVGSDCGLIRKTTSEQLSQYNMNYGLTSGTLSYGSLYATGNVGCQPILAPYASESLYELNIGDDWTNEYVGASTGKNRYGDDGKHDAFNYGNPKMTYLFKSLRRGETYRFGLIFYDKYGTASKVKWMQDVRVPELYEHGFETFASNAVSYSSHAIDLAVFPLGIQVEITGKLPDGIVGYEVVRCRRGLNNIKNIMQGVLARPIHRTSYDGNGKDNSSSLFCPTGYLTTARWCSGPSPYGPFERYGFKVGTTSNTDFRYASATNFDNFNVYQFVSAETTYQQESTQSMINSIGEGNLHIDGLKMLFGQNSSKPYSNGNINVGDNNVIQNAYVGEAGSIEMGHYNAFLWTNPNWHYKYKEDKHVESGVTHYYDLTLICRGMAYDDRYRFLGRGGDVINDGQQLIHYTASMPFWWCTMSNYYRLWDNIYDGGLNPTLYKYYTDWSAMWCGWYNYTSRKVEFADVYTSTLPNAGDRDGWGGPASAVTDVEPNCMSYIKLYEQSSSVTYRTPCVERTSNNADVYSLGHIVNLYASPVEGSTTPKYFDNDKMSSGTLADFTRIFTTRPLDIHADITLAFTPTVIKKGQLFSLTESTDKDQNLNPNNISNHKDVLFLNATFALNGDNYAVSKDCIGNIQLARQVGYSGGWFNPNVDVNNSYSYEACLGGPCLILKTTETANDALNGPTFSNVSAATTIDRVSSFDLFPHLPPKISYESAPPYVGINTKLELFQGDITSSSGELVSSDHWENNTGTPLAGGWTGDKDRPYYGSITQDIYGDFYMQRVSKKLSSVEEDANIKKLGVPQGIYNHSIAGTLLCNISKPYTVGNGYSLMDRSGDVYYSYGDYVDITSDNTSCVSFSGDCYIQLLEYVSGRKIINDLNVVPSKNASQEWLCWWNQSPQTKAVVYAIPLETNIDIEHEYGHSVSRAYANNDKQSNICSPQFEPYTLAYDSSVSSLSKTQTEAMYEYNGAYSVVNTARLFSPYTVADRESNEDDFDYRCFYSSPKENGEVIDSWTKFMSSNFLDVDTRHGAINKLKLFKDRLLFWQDLAFGMFDVNETAVVTSTDNRTLMLGESGVLQRFTYISTIHGIDKLSLALTTSDRALYWFDKKSNVLMSYSDNGLSELSTSANVRTYMNNDAKSAADIATIGYDKEFLEVLFNVYKGETLVYNENQGCFTAIYDNDRNTAIYYLPFNQALLTAIRLDTPWDEVNQSPKIGIYRENESVAASDGKTTYHMLYGNTLIPKVSFVVNAIPTTPKVYDITTFGGSFTDYTKLKLTYTTPHDQTGTTEGDSITRREWDYRLCVPRANNAEYGNRMRDKTIECTIDGGKDGQEEFSLEYIITKYRLSCS